MLGRRARRHGRAHQLLLVVPRSRGEDVELLGESSLVDALASRKNADRPDVLRARRKPQPLGYADHVSQVRRAIGRLGKCPEQRSVELRGQRLAAHHCRADALEQCCQTHAEYRSEQESEDHLGGRT